MIFIPLFSEKKWQKFSYEKKQKELLNYLIMIDKNYSEKKIVEMIIYRMKKCIFFSKNEEKLVADFDKVLRKDIVSDYRTFLIETEKIFAKNKKNFQDSQVMIEKKDNFSRLKVNLPVTIVLDDLRSAFNVGSIFRTAEFFGVEKVILCGITPDPNNCKVIKTAMGTEKYVRWSKMPDLQEALLKLKKLDYEILAIETAKNAIEYSEFSFPKPCAIVLGNEALGINENFLHLYDKFVKISGSGWKNSLNVGVATGIIISKIFSQWKKE